MLGLSSSKSLYHFLQYYYYSPLHLIRIYLPAIMLFSKITLAIAVFATTSIAQTVEGFGSGDCSGSGVFDNSVPNCTGACYNMGGTSNSVLLTKNGVTCSIYKATGCSGSYQSVGVKGGSSCTPLAVGSQSYRCYYGC